jgi:hypothetical protein
MSFPHLYFYMAINVFIWVAESHLELSEGRIQTFYAYPSALALLFLPARTVALTAFPLLAIALVYYYTSLSEKSRVLLIIYILSSAPFLKISLLVFGAVAITYKEVLRRFLDLEEIHMLAPAATASIIITYLIGTPF